EQVKGSRAQGEASLEEELSLGSEAAHHRVRFPDARQPDAIAPWKRRTRLADGQLLHPIARRRMRVGRHHRVLLSPPNHAAQASPPATAPAPPPPLPPTP